LKTSFLGRPSRVIVAACLTAGLVGCSSGPLRPSRDGLAAGDGRVAGHLVGPPGGPAPALTLAFTDGARTVKAVVAKGVYTLDLPAGVWGVRSTDGRACATGLHVSADAWQRADFVYPTTECQNLAGPPAGPSPPAPSKP
jgi:hypothetical protein